MPAYSGVMKSSTVTKPEADDWPAEPECYSGFRVSVDRRTLGARAID